MLTSQKNSANEPCGVPGGSGGIEPTQVIGLLMAVDARLNRIERQLSELQRSIANAKPSKEWLTTAEFAAEVGRAEFTVRGWSSRGRLKAGKTENGREWRIHRDELDRYRRQGLLPGEAHAS